MACPGGAWFRFRLGFAEGVCLTGGVNSAVFLAPAKINLFLAITDRRADGFHNLVSLVAPLDWGDTLRAELAPGAAGDVLSCDVPGLACDGSNLIVQAAQRFREATGWRDPVRFHLGKRIPMGAGLGGGSSDATSALLALNELAGAPLTREQLVALAAQVGSDCALFMEGAPVVMRGRGERVSGLPDAAVARIRGRRVLAFKPGFGIATPWAYKQLAARAPGSYLPAEAAEARLAEWLGDGARPLEKLLFNNMEGPAFEKYLALPTLLSTLSDDFGLSPLMSGSGSACFALLPDSYAVEGVVAAIRAAWGPGA
ncbi:MAG: 4-(cytidine 5'-diphospho)-2-C-methyl-D-erythritol kinase, partial [Opitutaceae bacterium]|nr:4-(cytidine 5'-diphospho)-2-C-methyl-D-erythritol kinase [Opitutaceae bacterium]